MCEYSVFRKPDYRDALRHPDCLCPAEHQNNKLKLHQRPQDKRIPTIDDSAIYYEPFRTNPIRSMSFVNKPFSIVNPPLLRQNWEEKGHKSHLINRNKSTRSANGGYQEKNNIVHNIDIEQEVPIYLDIDIYQGINNEHLFSKAKSELENFQLSENDLIECIDLHILIYSRNNDIDNDLIKIWDSEKLDKYKSLSDSDLLIDINSKCHHPSNIIKKSVQAITTSRPRKTEFSSPTDFFSKDTTSAHNKFFTNNEFIRNIKENIENGLNQDIYENNTSETTTTKTTNINSFWESNETTSTNVFQFYSTVTSSTDSVQSAISEGRSSVIDTTRPIVESDLTTESFIDKYNVHHEVPDSNHNGHLSDVNVKPAGNKSSSIYNFNVNRTVEQFNVNTHPTSTRSIIIIKEDLESPKTNNIRTVSYEYTTPNYLTSNYLTHEIKSTIAENMENSTTYTTNSFESDISEENQFNSTSTNTLSLKTALLLDTFTVPLDSDSSIIKHATQTEIPNESHNYTNIRNETKKKKIDVEQNLMLTTSLYGLNNTNNAPTTSASTLNDMSTNISKDDNITKDEILQYQGHNTLINIKETEDVLVSTRAVNEDSTKSYIDTKLDNYNPTTKSKLVNDESLSFGDLYSQDLDNLRSQPPGDEIFTVLNDVTTKNYLRESPKNTYLDFDKKSVVLTSNNNASRIKYPVEDIKIPKIITREFYNETAISEINDTEVITNSDYEDDLFLSESSNNESVFNTTVRSIFPPRKDSVINSDKSAELTHNNLNNILPEKRHDIVGKLYFLFGDNQVPARFVQDAEGQITLGIDGTTLCDKLLNNQNNSLIIAALCNSKLSENCIN